MNAFVIYQFKLFVWDTLTALSDAALLSPRLAGLRFPSIGMGRKVRSTGVAQMRELSSDLRFRHALWTDLLSKASREITGLSDVHGHNYVLKTPRPLSQL